MFKKNIVQFPVLSEPQFRSFSNIDNSYRRKVEKSGDLEEEVIYNVREKINNSAKFIYGLDV